MIQFPTPSVTADTVLIESRVGKVCLIRRAGEPFKDCWALPGGFFNPVDIPEEAIHADASVEMAGKRELMEEVGVDLIQNLAGLSYEFSHLADKIGRDPRGRVISHIFVAEFTHFYPKITAKDDAKDCNWFFIEDLLEGRVPLAFDHREVLNRVWIDICRNREV